MDYQSALGFLDSFIDYERRRSFDYNARRFNLERVSALLDRLGNPHFGRKIVHIAGTKGKGSTAAMISSILAADGNKVALYTSPHLRDIRERFRINGEMISRDELAAVITEISPVAEQMRRDSVLGDLTFFELYTAVGFLWFAERNADVWVVETGLGGRLDATNVVMPLVTVITPISLDHTHILGNTLPEIAREKAGIIKRGVPLVLSEQVDDVRETIRTVCRERSAPLFEVARIATAEIEAMSPAGERFSADIMDRRFDNLFLPLVGRHQVSNALAALVTIEVMGASGFPVSREAITTGLARTEWLGRIQLIQERPAVVFDVAHNPDSIRVLRKTLQEVLKFDKVIVVLGLSADKNVTEIGFELSGFADVVIATQAKDNPRAMESEQLASKLDGMFDTIKSAATVLDAYRMAHELANPNDLICVTGSFYHVGELMVDLGL